MSDILIENCHLLSPALEKFLKKDCINPHYKDVLECFSVKVYRRIFDEQASEHELFYSMIEKIENGVKINKTARKELSDNPKEFYRKASHYACSVFLYDDPDKTDGVVSLSKVNKKILIGTIDTSTGYSDAPDSAGHINWWIFRNFNPIKVFSLSD
jgi:hypothetical protein